jgi:hypothetical protein
MEETRMPWATPQLIVLSRGTPEESVLTHCKFIGAPPTGGADTRTQDGCNDVDAANCGACLGRPPNAGS